MKKFLLIISALILSGFAMTAPVLCGSSEVFAYDGAIISTEDGEEGIMHVLRLVVDIMSAVIIVAAVIGIVVVGIQYLTAGGNEEQTRKAKRRLFEIVIGITAYVLMYALLRWLLPGFTAP